MASCRAWRAPRRWIAALNASGYGGRRDWTIVTFNDAAHLATAAFPTESPHDIVPTPASETRLTSHPWD